jgi:hypothetical protein
LAGREILEFRDTDESRIVKPSKRETWLTLAAVARIELGKFFLAAQACFAFKSAKAAGDGGQASGVD